MRYCKGGILSTLPGEELMLKNVTRVITATNLQRVYTDDGSEIFLLNWTLFCPLDSVLGFI